MLCPSCGVSVGDAVRLCDNCEKVRLASQPQAAAQPASDPNAAQHAVAHQDGLVVLFNFLSTALGRLLMTTIVLLFLIMGVMVCLPKEGMLGSVLIALSIFGFILIWSAKYVYAFDDTRHRRFILLGVGAGIVVLGVLFHSLSTGKGLKATYDHLEHELTKTSSDVDSGSEEMGQETDAFSSDEE